MQTTPSPLAIQYRNWLNQHAVPPAQQSHYCRWLHMYLAACHAEGLDPLRPESLDHWLGSLNHRYPSAFMQNQAQEAVRLYVRLESSHLLSDRMSKQEPVNHSTATGISQTTFQQPAGLTTWSDIFSRFHLDPQLKSLSPQTRRNYRSWIQRFCRFCDFLPPDQLSNAEILAFVSALAKQNLAETTLQQAVCALRSLYRVFLRKEPPSWQVCLAHLGHVTKPQRQTVRAQSSPLTPQDIAKLKSALESPYDLLVELIWTYGLELGDCLKIRLRDLSPTADTLTIYPRRKRPAIRLPVSGTFMQALLLQRERACRLFRLDLNSGSLGVFLDDLPPGEQVTHPLDPSWQYLFPASRWTRLGQSGEIRRYHLHPSLVQSKLRQASEQIRVHITASRLRAQSLAQPQPQARNLPKKTLLKAV